MSSWLNTKAFASLAKTALNEAQKTLDRALEIPDEELASVDNDGKWGLSIAYDANIPSLYFSEVKILLENRVKLKNWFAGTILIGGNSVVSQPSSNHSKSYSTSGVRRVSEDVQNEDSSQQKMDTSAWGSFTGSFFHASDIGSGNDPSVSPSLEGKLTISRHILCKVA